MRRIDPAIVNAFRRAESIALISHISPDGDTIGSALALRLALLAMGKSVRVFCQDKVPDNLMMLPGASCYKNESTVTPGDRYDLCCSVDVSTASRLGRVSTVMEQAAQRAIIDHHGTNPRDWAPISEVDGDAPACAILIYALIRELGVALTGDMAGCLYTAIVTDTGNFSYSGITPETFLIQAELMQTGFDLTELNRRLFRQQALPHLMLVKKALESMTLYQDGHVTVTRITQQDMAECHALPEHTDNVVNYSLEIEGVHRTLFAREAADGSYKMSLRGIPGYPVDQIAAALGGGGHTLAAGISMHGDSLDACVDQVLTLMLNAEQN